MYQSKKSFFSTCLMAMMVLAATILPVSAEEAQEPATAETEAASTNSANTREAYIHTSTQYGYTILCPYRPAGIIPASMLYEDKKGDVLIFENDGYTIRHAWVVLVDAFDNKAVPDLNKISEEDAKSYLEKLMHSNGYEGISLVNLTKDNKGIFAVTAKEIEIDSDGDGVFDMTATAETQEAVTFFRTEKGRCFSVQLIDNPELRPEAVGAYQFGVSSLRELDSKAVQKK